MYELLWVMHFEAEEIYEIARKKLLQNPNFDVNSIFRQISIHDKDFITQEDVSLFLIFDSIFYSLKIIFKTSKYNLMNKIFF